MTDEQWILTAVPLSQSPELERLKEDYNIIFWDDFEKDPESYYDKIKVLFFSPEHRKTLTEEFLRKTGNLKVVSTFSTGLSHLDLPLLRKFNIKISRVPGTVTAETTADHGFTLMMMAGRRIVEWENWDILSQFTRFLFVSVDVEAAKGYAEGAPWDMEKNWSLTGHDIHHATLGIVGMGLIGFEVARRAKGFNMEVLYHNRHRREDDSEVDATYCATLEDLLPKVDYLMLTPPLTDNTRGMMGRDQFKLMKPTSIIINISRGPIVVTEDLVEALKDSTIGGAAMDVTDPGPLPHHHPLMHMPNVIVTPHVGMFTHGGTSRMCSMVASNLRAAMEGLPMPGQLPDPLDNVTPNL